jgi:hypothetical protein
MWYLHLCMQKFKDMNCFHTCDCLHNISVTNDIGLGVILFFLVLILLNFLLNIQGQILLKIQKLSYLRSKI